jgi:hypothetical protein
VFILKVLKVLCFETVLKVCHSKELALSLRVSRQGEHKPIFLVRAAPRKDLVQSKHSR